MFTFTTTLDVPSSIVNIIGQNIRKNFKDLMLKDNPDGEVYEIDMLLNKAIGICVNDSIKTCEGHSLMSEDVYEIANFIRFGMRVPAIKAFRKVTSTGMKQASDFIKSFEEGTDGAQSFINSFI